MVWSFKECAPSPASLTEAALLKALTTWESSR